MVDINLEHLERLAALSLSTEEAAHARADLERIINMIDSMAGVPTDGVEPMAHPLDAAQALRPDTVTEVIDRDELQSVAPGASEGFYLVPRVVE